MSVAAARLRASRRTRALQILLAVAAAGLIIGLPVLFGGLPHTSTVPQSAAGEAAEAAARPVLDVPAFGAATGVRVAQVAVTGDGGIIDLRYQVLDPDKAGAVHSPETPPSLADEQSGVNVNQLVMGHVHNGDLKAGVTYYLLFFNPGNLVQRGDRVTVQLGEARLAHVRVR